MELLAAPTPNGWKVTIMVEELREAGVGLADVTTTQIDISDRPNGMAWFDRVRARPGVSRGLAYGVPEDEIDRWSPERRKHYASGGAAIASNDRLRSDL